jgi:ATP-dependent RNA helicase HelY
MTSARQQATGTNDDCAPAALETLRSRIDFDLDDYQHRAIAALGQGSNVIVSAPTGSGKTLVAEYAIDLARARGQRLFYTAPIKALSNQKFNDLCREYGPDAVGLLTGDHSIRPDAPVVIMTTEVLRNMIYTGSRQLDGLFAVVLDEVHFLQDPYRGPVWEEIIIHLDREVRLVCLSATVSNAAELGEWVTTLRGTTAVVTEDRRPVDLEQLVMFRSRTDERIHLKEISRLRRSNDRGRGSEGDRRSPEWSTPNRLAVISELAQRSLLPAIVFIFSRNGCDEAAESARRAGVSLTSPTEQVRIDEILDERLAHLDPTDLVVLGAERFRERLRHGVAAHHAGMVPTFKEVVESCFAEGLVKVVFATETLAVGINMPARSVVIERLSRFTGEHHRVLSPGEFTQLTGRAGRRGIDSLGSAVVLWNRFVQLDQLVDLATSTSFELRSVFAPTFNMAVNLVRTYSEDRARELLAMSFAQFQAERLIVETESELRDAHRRRAALRQQTISPFGDIDDYRRRNTGSGRGPIEGELNRLKPGDVIEVRTGRDRQLVAVISTGHRRSGIRIGTVDTDARFRALTADDLSEAPVPVASIRLPTHRNPRDRQYRREVAARLRRTRVRRGRRAVSERRPRHPVERDPQLKQRLRALDRLERLDVRIAELDEHRSHHRGLLQQFDAILHLLEARGYLDRSEWSLTEAGELLASIFHELDLLIAETVRRGHLDSASPAEVALLASAFVYEPRSTDTEPVIWSPSSAISERLAGIAELSDGLNEDQRRLGLNQHRAPNAGFGAIAYAWVSGEALIDVVGDDEITGGDFVRTMKMLVDLLGQLARSAPLAETRRTCAQAARLAARDVVTESSFTTAEPLSEER